MDKIYYKLSFKLLSPLALSNRTGKTTDKDILLSSDGKPYIPGTAIAGLLRSCLAKKDADNLFGALNNQGSQQNSNESKVITYDAVFVGEPCVSVRDGVGLDERKTAKKGSKFNFEVVERDSVFETFLEVDSEDIAKEVENILPAIKTFTIGSKSTRGYGYIETTSVIKKTFNDENFGDWLEFVVFNEKEWQGAETITINQNPAKCTEISLRLNVNGSFIIRRYTTTVSKKEKNPDYYTLISNKSPVIPGTSWAGVFRSHMKKLARNCGYEGYGNTDISLFGYVNESNKSSARSKISFSESVIDQGEQKTITRNSIDRFTGGAKDTALFTETVCYGGKTNLVIMIEEQLDGGVAKLLAAAICDLNNGILSVGGETSIGRGMFTVSDIEINGEKLNVDYSKIFGALCAAMNKEAKP